MIKIAENRRELNIKWNVRDVSLSIIILILFLAAIYFGASRLFAAITGREVLRITAMDDLSFSVLYGIQVFLMLGVVWFFAIFWRKSSLKDLGLNYYSIWKTIWYSFLSLIVIFVLSFLYVFLMNTLFGIEAPPSQVDQLIMEGDISSSILLVVIVLVAPVAEEIFFRGYLYSAFKKAWGVGAGLFLSSLLFALAHMELYSFVPIFVIGWILAYIFEKTKSLFPIIFLHAAYNLILILILLGRIDMIRMY